MGIQVKAHIRAGRKVKAYVRGGGGASRSAQYRKASLSGISSEAVKKFYNPLKKLPKNPLKPSTDRENRRMTFSRSARRFSIYTEPKGTDRAKNVVSKDLFNKARRAKRR